MDAGADGHWLVKKQDGLGCFPGYAAYLYIYHNLKLYYYVLAIPKCVSTVRRLGSGVETWGCPGSHVFMFKLLQHVAWRTAVFGFI
eukprot:1155620-Pelagomonas_calceolata.AAC.4